MKQLSFICQYTRILAILMLFSAVFATLLHASEDHGDEHGDEHDELEAFDQGPHGGRLLTQGDISVELLLSGHGDGPGYKAWVTRHGEPVTNRNMALNAELVRLDGEMLALDFTRDNQHWQGTEGVAEPHSFDITVMLVIGNQNYEWTFGSYEGRVEIAGATAAKAGVISEIAGPGPINQTLTVYGRIVVDPANLSHLRARYPGTIIQIDANIGDRVEVGQVLAEIESSENLRRYELPSPLTGVVIARDGNPGELAQQQALLTIANYDELWVEFQIFPGQARDVAVGQAVRVFGEQQEAQSVIRHLMPDDNGQPFLHARVPLDNTEGQWTPGLLLSGSIAIRQTDVPLRVKFRAVQQMDDQDVVFIQSGDAFEARPVTLGMTDGEYVEIIDGLRPGVRYVAENSFLIKADLGKSGAAHNH